LHRGRQTGEREQDGDHSSADEHHPSEKRATPESRRKRTGRVQIGRLGNTLDTRLFQQRGAAADPSPSVMNARAIRTKYAPRFRLSGRDKPGAMH
jgi:hypothetical protein